MLRTRSIATSWSRIAVVVGLALAACSGSDVSRSLGARCDLSEQCAETCLPPPDWPGGFCTTSCDNDASCSGSAACVDEQGGVCLFKCLHDIDCQFLGAGYFCLPKPDHGGGGDVTVCAAG